MFYIVLYSRPKEGLHAEPEVIRYTNKENVLQDAMELDCYYVSDVVVPEDAKVHQEDDKTWVTDRAIFSNIRFVEDFVSELSKKEIEDVIRRNGYTLRYVKEQTPYLCELAVRQNGYALRYVKEQTPYICELAVRQVAWALQHVKEQTPYLCELAVRQDGRSLQFVKEQTPYLCELAVRQDGHALQYVKEQTPYLCKLAVEQNVCACQYVWSVNMPFVQSVIGKR